jgi:putative hemolysin
LSAEHAYTISLVIVVFFITYVSIVIGELVPKTVALNNPEKVAIKVSRSINVVKIIFYPFVKLLAVSTSFINRLIGIKPKEDRVTEMELRAMLKTASNEGVIAQEENIIHEQVFYFSDKRSIHIMTHRTDVEWVDISESKDVIINELLKTKHSNILACNKQIDDFVGVISMRNFLMKLTKKEEFSIEELIIEPLIVPSTLRAQKVLESMKEKRQFMAVVVDEYGSLEGIITMHDFFENILGFIPEEADTDPQIYMRNEYSAIISGEAPIELLSYLDEEFIVDFDEIDYSTIAGFVFSNLNKIPSVGDYFVSGDLSFEVMDVDNNRIDKVLVTNLRKEKELKDKEQKSDKTEEN